MLISKIHVNKPCRIKTARNASFQHLRTWRKTFSAEKHPPFKLNQDKNLLKTEKDGHF